MDPVLDQPLTTEAFLAWEDGQEGKFEFDGRKIIAMTGGSFAHQDIVYNLRWLTGRLLARRDFRVGEEMCLRIGDRIRYPDAVAIFEVLSDDTATTDRVEKLIEYSRVPSLRSYVLLEQTKIAATLFRREPGGKWTAKAHIGGDLELSGLNVTLPLADVYQGLTFSA